MEENELHNLSMRSRRSWDDDFCLKRQFTALIPAFDPRPGRSNVQQIQDVEVPLECKRLFWLLVLLCPLTCRSADGIV